MLSIPGHCRILLYAPAADMRKSFQGLSALVYQHLGEPQDGTYYVFVNRIQTRVKIMYFDGDGMALWYKRLEQGQFAIPQVKGNRIELDRRQLSMLLEGVIPLKTRKRFSLRISDKNEAA